MGQDPGRGTLILVLGILSIVFCSILGPFAWLMGKGDLAKIKAGQIAPEAEQLTKVGMILGIVGTCLMVVGLAAVCLWVAAVMIFAGAAASGKMKAALDILDTVVRLT